MLTCLTWTRNVQCAQAHLQLLSNDNAGAAGYNGRIRCIDPAHGQYVDAVQVKSLPKVALSCVCCCRERMLCIVTQQQATEIAPRCTMLRG